MKRIFKWVLGLVLAMLGLAVLAVIVLLLTYNSILRIAMERAIHEQTGMNAKIGRLHIALLSPTVEIQDFKINNPPDYGNTPFLDIPEIHMEYDRAALARHEFHITLLRFNLGELDIVKNQAGRTNIFLGGLKVPAGKSGGAVTNATADFRRQTGFDFTGIDELNVSIGRFRFIDLQNPGNNREQDIGIEDKIIPNVKSPVDLTGLAALVALKSDGFFDVLVDPKSSGLDALKRLGQ